MLKLSPSLLSVVTVSLLACSPTAPVTVPTSDDGGGSAGAGDGFEATTLSDGTGTFGGSASGDSAASDSGGATEAESTGGSATDGSTTGGETDSGGATTATDTTTGAETTGEDPGCTPSCSGKHCGDDGCGGSCGTCQNFQSCVDQLCVSDGLDCSGIATKGWELCNVSDNSCAAVFTDSAGCLEVCAAAGLGCTAVYENVDGACSPDNSKPPLSCVPESGHQSDYCVCGGEPLGCIPDTCETSDAQCGAVSDGCGGTLQCGDNCPTGLGCVDGYCGFKPEDCTSDFCLAFPGAEGEGRFAKGGRGGDVCVVTNLNDSGGGSLRDCANTQSGARTVVFRVGGMITLSSPLTFTKDRLTLAGETAPGDGITIRGYQVMIKADDVIVRHLRFRSGDVKLKKCSGNNGGGSFTEDSVTLEGKRMIVDHVSASFGVDENLSGGSTVDDLTVQYSIMAEGLAQTGLWHGECESNYKPGGEKMHSMGGLYKPKEGDGRVSIHHNLYAHNGNRNPAVGSYESDQSFHADIRNNVIYNCVSNGYTSGKSKEMKINYIGNYGIWGPDGDHDRLFTANGPNNPKLYVKDNRLDTNKNKSLDGSDKGSSMFGGDYSTSGTEFAFEPVTTHSSVAAATLVLEWAGARPWSRDKADKRVIADVEDNTGHLIDSVDDVGGWGTLNAGTPVKDSDSDGMPDSWEQKHGTDPKKKDNNGDKDGDGYTNLENYLHWAARPTQ